MTIAKNYARQDVKFAYVDINLADLVSGSDFEAIDLPPNSVVLSGQTITTEAWNSTTSDVLDVGDGDSQNRYLNDGNMHALAARVPLVPTGYITNGNPLTVRWTSGGGTPTTGKVRLEVQYAQLGRSDSTYEG